MSKNLKLLEEIEKSVEDKEVLSKIEALKKSIIRQNERMEKIISQSDTEQLRILNLSEELEAKNEKIKVLLNNANQVFLSFDESLKIDKEYSKKAYEIFKKDIAGCNIAELLYPNNKEKQEFFTNTLKYILNEKPSKQEILISLLDKEFVINDRYIHAEFKILPNRRYMLILTDVTEKKALDEAIKQEQLKLKMVVNAVTNKEQFMELITSFKTWVAKLDDYKDINKLDELKRKIHTFKGLFAQKNFYYIVSFLHNLEDLIQQSKQQKEVYENILNLTPESFLNELQKDLDIIEEILGKEFFISKNSIEIDKNRIFEIIKEIEKADEIDKKWVIRKLKELTYANIKTFLKPYEKLIEQLSFKFKKNINYHFDIEDIYVPKRMEHFLNTLVHIFVNSIDHGIEVFEERIENKEEAANIWCRAYQKENFLYISIKDDGRGLNLEKIKQIAIEKNLYKGQLDENDILNIIFEDGFSSKKSVSEYSGRGVGLSSVKEEVDKLYGDIKIINKDGEGLEFLFKIPLVDFDIKSVVEEILLLLTKKTKEYLSNYLEIDIKHFDKQLIEFANKEINIAIDLKGDIPSTIYMGVDKEFATLLVEKFLFDTDIKEFSEKELEKLYFEVLSEILNITLGNILKDISIVKDGYKVDISIPYVLEKNDLKKYDKTIFYDIIVNDYHITLGHLM